MTWSELAQVLPGLDDSRRASRTKEFACVSPPRPVRRHRHVGLPPASSGRWLWAAISQRQQISLSHSERFRRLRRSNELRDPPGPRQRLPLGRKAEHHGGPTSSPRRGRSRGCHRLVVARDNCMGDDTGRCITHELWTNPEHQDVRVSASPSTRSLVDDQRASQSIEIEAAPSNAPISTSLCSSPSA